MMKKSVLIVEDEEDIRELVSYHLLKEGYQVASVASGEEALAVAGEQPPDLILLDLMLPGVDGLAVCQKLRADPRTEHVAVMMLTAKSEEADMIRGLNLGANGLRHQAVQSEGAPGAGPRGAAAGRGPAARRPRGGGTARTSRNPQYRDSSRPARGAGGGQAGAD